MLQFERAKPEAEIEADAALVWHNIMTPEGDDDRAYRDLPAGQKIGVGSDD